jgi:streptogramin lyase
MTGFPRNSRPFPRSRKLLTFMAIFFLAFGAALVLNQGPAAAAAPRGPAARHAVIAGGGNHTLAIPADGSLWACGFNTYGQLGLGDSGTGTQRTIPTRVGSDYNWVAVAAGQNHILGIKADGTLWAWGITPIVSWV